LADYRTQNKQLEIERFLMQIERRAFVVADIGVSNKDDALDIVQEAMLAFARKYSSKPIEQWKPLFFRILQNKINDCHRARTKQTKGLLGLFVDSGQAGSEDNGAISRDEPVRRLGDVQFGEQLISALKKLPPRQQQVFILRSWEGLSVALTAQAMGCSEGSVKTHYSRALHALKKLLGDYR